MEGIENQVPKGDTKSAKNVKSTTNADKYQKCANMRNCFRNAEKYQKLKNCQKLKKKNQKCTKKSRKKYKKYNNTQKLKYIIF